MFGWCQRRRAARRSHGLAGPGLAGLGLALVLGTPATAQQFGQWSWTGFLGAGQTRYDNTFAGTPTNRYSERDLNASLSLTGFLVHPAIARFDLGLDVLSSRLEVGGHRDQRLLGFSAGLDVLQYGNYPLKLYLRRQRIDYQDLAATDPFSLAALPRAATTWGGRWRLRQGPLAGTLLGVERSATEFLDPLVAPEHSDREFIDWGRSGARLQQHLVFEHARREFSLVGFALDDLTLNVDERADLGRDWRWDLVGIGISRRFEPSSGSEVTSRDLHATQRLIHPLRGSDQLDLRWDLGLSGVVGSRLLSNLLSAAYHWRVGHGIEVLPAIEYGWSNGDDQSLRAPRVNVGVAWTATSGAFNEQLSANVGWGEARSETRREAKRSSFVSYGIAGLVGVGSAGGLREELELSAAKNDLQVASQPLLDLPDLGGRAQGLGIDDLVRGRLKLSRQGETVSFAVWVEQSHRQTSVPLVVGRQKNDTTSATAQLGLGRLSLSGGAGETRVTDDAREQRVSYRTAGLNLRLLGSLRVEGSYRSDRRRVGLVPDVDATRYEGGLQFQLGLLTAHAQVFDAKERVAGGAERRNRGVQWAVGRSFGGWLPIATGTKRRGTIQ